MAADPTQRLGSALGDRLIAAKQPRRPWLRPALVGGLLLFGVVLLRWRGEGGPALVEPGAGSAAVARSSPARIATTAVTAASELPPPSVRTNPSFAEARQQRALFEAPPADTSACGYAGGAFPPLSVELVRAHSKRGVLFGALATASMSDMVINYAGHLAPLIGECAALIGFMDVGAAGTSAPALSDLASRLRAGASIGAYTTGKPPPAEGAQAGRWSHARDLFAACAGAGVDLVLSDVDVVWLRDPWPYLQLAFEQGRGGAGRAGALDALISTDSTNDMEKPLPAHARLPGMPAELQLESASLCGRSLNIGVLALRGSSNGAALLLAEAAAAVAAMPAKDIDQGAINRRWKGETRPGAWRQAGGLACEMLGGRARLGVLPAAQFLSLLGYSVRRLHALRAVEPFAVHATFLRTQEPAGKLMRLREEGLFLDPPAHYERGTFLTYTPHVPPEMLAQPPLDRRGAVPRQHMALVEAQLAQLRQALALAAVLGRALVLPRMRCSCELGFGPGHVNTQCNADSAITLPYDCPADHWLRPDKWLELGWAHRERGFLDDPRVPDAVLTSRAHARQCALNRVGGCCLTKVGVSESVLKEQLGGCEARVLDMGDVRGLFGGFANEDAGPLFDASLQGALSSWCCSTEPEYKRSGGLVRYALRNSTTSWR